MEDTAQAAQAGEGGGAGAQMLAAIPTRGYAVPPWLPKRAALTAAVVGQLHNWPWDLDYQRFEVIDFLGSGAYGRVALALDHLNGAEFVAIKRISMRLGEHWHYSMRFYRELRILRAMQHPCIVRLKHVSCPGIHDARQDLLRFESLLLVCEPVETDLDKIEFLSAEQTSYIFKQMVEAVKFMHAARLLHRDIKPENVLVADNCSVKLCDVGLSRTFDQEADPIIMGEEPVGPAGGGGAQVPKTLLVQTRYYRAPELPLYSDGLYTAHIDTWSLGCCLAEMLAKAEGRRKEVLFFGASDDDQLGAILGLLRPDAASVARLRTPEARAMAAALLQAITLHSPPAPLDPHLLQRWRAWREGLIQAHPDAAADFPDASADFLGVLQRLHQRYPSASLEALDLLTRMLSFHAEERITLHRALLHPYFQGVSLAHIAMPPDPAPLHFGAITEANVHDLIVEEIRQWNPQIPANWKAVVLHARQAAAAAAAAGGAGHF